jgi:exodeoxyribonuclease V, alpha subunit
MHHLAHYLARQSGCPEHGDTLAALLNALQEVHDRGDTLIQLDDAQRAAADTLAATPLLADDDRAAPLTRRGDRLWISRNYQQEARLAAMIRERLHAADTPAAPVPADGLRAEQQNAVRLARSRRLALINGGPGTGKTYTIARLIHAEQQADPKIRIALAAPTGKAAKRMEESLAAAGVQDLPAQTLHRLLGIGTDGQARYHTSRHLPHDLIIIDEASMLSLELAHALIAATAPASRLILLGDADQLAAVEPGAILHDLSHHPALQNHRITLRESQRFRADSGIGQLAAILGDPDNPGARLLEALQTREAASPIHWYPTPDANLYRALIAPYQPYLEKLQDAAANPQELLNTYDQYRILCAGHHGALGTRRINAALRQLHQRAQGADPSLAYYHGLPLMILENDHRQQLYNGDTGICLEDDNGLQLHLPGHEPVPLARLNPATLTDAYALSIHKSQGSEYPHVALVLDEHAERLLSRELLYTGITRSKGRLDIYASADALQSAAATPTRRHTGLAWHLDHPHKAQTNH